MIHYYKIQLLCSYILPHSMNPYPVSQTIILIFQLLCLTSHFSFDSFSPAGAPLSPSPFLYADLSFFFFSERAFENHMYVGGF